MSLSKFIPGRKDGSKAQTASGLAQEYRSRIEQFVQHVDGRKSKALQGDGDYLQKLFGWVSTVYDEREKLNECAIDERAARKKAEGQVEALRQRLAEHEQRIDDLSGTIAVLRSEHDQQLLDKDDEIDRNRRDAKSDAEKMEIRYQQEQQKHEMKVKDMDASHYAETNRLKVQLFASVDVAKAWPDDKLQLEFKVLTSKINTISSPSRIKLPKEQHIQLDFDKDGFLSRVTNDKAHILLKSTIWSILCERFFSLPFGFGILGPDLEHNPLLQLFGSLHMVANGTRGTASDLEIFRNNQLGNTWRSATIEHTISALSSDNTSSANETARISATNLQTAVSLIESLFTSISKASALPAVTTNAEIRQVALTARGIALQFGINRANLQLVVPPPGQSVTIGADYHDAYEKATKAGNKYVVDLVKRPGLQKVVTRPDGTVDTNATRMMEPCEVFVRP